MTTLMRISLAPAQACRFYILLALCVLTGLPALAVTPRAKLQGDCAQGNKTITVSGQTSSTSTPVMRSFPSCTVTIYAAGTVTLASIYADDNGTAKANPFTAASDGQYFFYADDGRYDVRLAGTGMTTFTRGDWELLDWRFLSAGTGAVARVFKDKLAETVSVKDFGAVGDGTTDDTAHIQNALTYAASVQRPLVCGGKATVYFVASTLNVPSNTDFGYCNLKLTTATAITMKQDTGQPAVQYIYLHDITITGNSTVGSRGLYIGGVNGNFVHDIRLERVNVFQTGIGEETGNLFYFTQKNCDIAHNVGDGWKHSAELYATTLTFQATVFRDNGGAGMNNASTIQGWFCFTCFSERNVGAEFVVGNVTNALFSGTYTETTANGVVIASNAFDLTNSKQVTISGGFFLRHQYVAYSAGGSQNISIDGIYTTVGFGDARSLGTLLFEGTGNTGLKITNSWLTLPVTSNAINTHIEATFDKAFAGGEKSNIGDNQTNQLVQQQYGNLASTTGTNFVGPRTNLFMSTNNMTQSPWSATRAAVTAAVQTNPFGTTEAFKLAETATTGTHFVVQAFDPTTVTANSNVTVSVSVKVAERSAFQFLVVDKGGAEHYCYMLVDTGTIVYSSNPPQCNLISQGNGWWRGTIQQNVGTGGGTGSALITLRSGSNISYAGTDGFGLYLFGPTLTTGFALAPYYANPSQTAVMNLSEGGVLNHLEVLGTVTSPALDLLLTPALNTMALFGDSITLESGGNRLIFQDPSLSARYSSYENGYFSWANAIMGQRFEVIINAGIGGNTTSQMLARVDTDVIAYHPRWCFVLGGTNNLGATSASVQIIADLSKIYAKLNAAGIRIAVGTIPPSQSLNGSAANSLQWWLANQWIRSNAVANGYLLVDIGTVYSDITSLYPIPKSGYSLDGTHPSLKGALAVASAIATAFGTIVPPVQSVLPMTNHDTENFTVNGFMLGTGGTLASLTGQVADSWAAKFNGASSTKSASKVAPADGQGSWQQLAMTGGSGSEIWLEQLVSGYTAGDKLVAYCEFQADAAMDGQLDLTLIVTATDPTNRYTSHSGYPVDTTGGQPPTTGVLRTGIGILPADVATVTIHVGFTGTAGTIRLRKFRVVKVP